MNIILLASLIACGDKSTDTSSTDPNEPAQTGEPGEPGSTGEPDSTDEPDDSANDVAPNISAFDAWCYADSNAVDTWGFAIDYTDPDGDDTVPGLQMGAIIVKNGGGEQIATVDPVCGGMGGCLANIPASQAGNIACAAAESVTFTATIVDNEGNSSNSVEVNGRAGTSPEG